MADEEEQVFDFGSKKRLGLPKNRGARVLGPIFGDTKSLHRGYIGVRVSQN